MIKTAQELQAKSASLQAHLFNSVFVPVFADRLATKLASRGIQADEGVKKAAAGDRDPNASVVSFLKLAAAYRTERDAQAAKGLLAPETVKAAAAAMKSDERLNKLTSHFVGSVCGDEGACKLAEEIAEAMENKPELAEELAKAPKFDETELPAGTPEPHKNDASTGKADEPKKD